MSGGAAASKAEVENTLQLLGQQLTDSGHPLQAIKCYVALLSQSLMPTDEAATLLKLGQLLMEHTHNVQEAKQHLQKVVCPRPLAVSILVLQHIQHVLTVARLLLVVWNFCVPAGPSLSSGDAGSAAAWPASAEV